MTLISLCLLNLQQYVNDNLIKTKHTGTQANKHTHTKHTQSTQKLIIQNFKIGLTTKN